MGPPRCRLPAIITPTITRPGGPKPASGSSRIQFALARALSKGETTSAEELAILTRDGQPRTILSYARPIRDELEKIVGGVAVHVDITGRKQDEETLKDADRRKDEFLAMLAHELRNPFGPHPQRPRRWCRPKGSRSNGLAGPWT